MTDKDQQIVIPVVFLGLYSQPQYILVDVPNKAPIPQSDVEDIPSEEMALLRDHYCLQDIHPGPQEGFTIPAFMPSDVVDQLLAAFEIPDDHERFRVCYAVLQTYPQLLQSLNEYLPKQYHFPPDTLQETILDIDIPNSVNYDLQQVEPGKLKTTIFTKALQQQLQYLREMPNVILQDNLNSFRKERMFETNQQMENFGKVCNFKSSGPCELKVSGQNQLKLTKYFSCGPQWSEKPIVNTTLIYEHELQEMQFAEGRSSFMDDTKNEASGKFLMLLKDNHKSLHLNKFKDLMKEFDVKHISIEQLQLATTMLYFDKLDVLYYFQNMQRLSQNDSKQSKLGWPTTCPVRKPDQTVMHIIKCVDDFFNDLNKRGMRNQMITELYNSVFNLARRSYEHNFNKQPSNLKIDISTFKNYTEKNNKMVEFKIEDVTGYTMVVKMLKSVYDSGQNAVENGEDYNKFYDTIFNQIRQSKINNKKASRQARNAENLGEKTEGEDFEETVMVEVHKKWKKTSAKLPTLKMKQSGKALIISLIKAGKLNAISIFDIDHFFDLCLSVCGLDVDYPAFQYDEFMRRTSFGDQHGLIKAARNLYLVLLRFNFGSTQFSKTLKQFKEIIEFCRFANPFPSNQVLLSPHAILEKEELAKSEDEKEEIEVAPDDSDDTRLNLKMLMSVIEGTISFGEFVREVVDKQEYFNVKAKDVIQLQCSESCNCENRVIALSIPEGFDQKVKDNEKVSDKEKSDKPVEIPKKINICESIFDSIKYQLKPGFVLLNKNDVFGDELDDPQSFTYISTLNQYQFANQDEIDECFYVFQNYSTFNNYKRMNYACQLLLAIELFYNSSTNMQSSLRNLMFDDLFSAFYSCRLDAVLSDKDGLPYWQKYQTIFNMYDRANMAPPHPQIRHLERLQKPYDRSSVVSELFKCSMTELDFKVVAANCYLDNPLTSWLTPKDISITYNSIVHHQLRSPDDMVDMLKEQVVEKEQFVFPPATVFESPDYEPEADISILKKDIHINKLVQKGYSYKVTPSEMYELLKKQHPQNYDIGCYEYDPCHKPEDFFEMRQLANSVLNRGKYFTIPFGSEAARPVENSETEEQDNFFTYDLAGLMDKHQQQQSQSAIKSQYYKYIAPTGAEARICHIEEEQLCFGLFRLKARMLMKILIEWMCIYTPAIIKFFDCSLTTTTMASNPDLKAHYQYRQNIDQHLSNKYDQKQNTYFYQNEYREYCDMDVEASQSEEDDGYLVMNKAFSLEFDRVLADIYTIYVQYSKQTSPDAVLGKAQVNSLVDDWAKNGCYAPIQPWPFGNQSQFSMPPPPTIPLNFQLFLTQIYTTGDILDEMYRNPILAIPVIARTVQHQVAASQHAEQRAAIAWRLLYPESYYRSIDHYWVCLQSYDKKFLQQKPMLTDMVRRVNDYETGNNPNLLDSCIDPCLPKIFDICYFPQYAKQIGIDMNDPAFLLSYNLRLSRVSLYTPQSIFRTQFKFSSTDQLVEVLRVGSALGIPQQTQMLAMILSKSLFTSALKDTANFSNELNQNQILNVFGKGEYAQKLCDLYPSINLSLFFTEAELKSILQQNHSRFEWEKHKTVFKSVFEKQAIAENIDPRQMVFMEDLVMDIRNIDQLNSVKIEDIKLYEDPQVTQFVNDSLKTLSYTQNDLTKLLRTEFDKCQEQNLFMPSLFQNNGQPKCLDDIYSHYHHMTMPNPSPRSVALLRNCLFNEKMAEDEVEAICSNQLSQQQLADYFESQNERFKKDQMNRIFSQPTLQQQKQTASVIIPNLQNELIKRIVFDKFFVPLLFNSEGKVCVRYMDQELYILLRFLHIACTRLEYSILVVEHLPSTVRQIAVHGARSTMPFPYSDINQNNIACSLFGYNIIEYQEQQQQKALTKTFVEGIPAQVSQRVFHGHQPYINLTNLSDISICGCRCGALNCSFCGGIAAGLNGTLSGNINHRAAINQSVDLTHSLCNGIFKYKSLGHRLVDDYQWEDIVFMRTWTSKGRDFKNMLPYHFIDNQISLLYQLAPVIPHYQYESQIPDAGDSNDRMKSVTPSVLGRPARAGRHKRELNMRSTEVSETDDDHQVFDVNQKMQEIRSMFVLQENPSYFISNYGQRIADVMLMLPPPDQYTQDFYANSKNVFVNEYIHSFSHYQSIISQPSSIEDKPYDILTLLDYNQQIPLYQVDDYVQSILLNSTFVDQQLKKHFANGIDGFQQRNFITRPRSNFKREMADLYYVLMQMSPNNKDDDLNTEVYSVLGIYSYPLLSLRKLMQNIYKRIEGVSVHLLQQHFDIINMQLFKSNKCTTQNSLTSALLTFGIWQNINDIPVLPIYFHQSVTQLIDEVNEDIYFVESYNNFISLQCLLVESSKPAK